MRTPRKKGPAGGWFRLSKPDDFLRFLYVSGTGVAAAALLHVQQLPYGSLRQQCWRNSLPSYQSNAARFHPEQGWTPLPRLMPG